MAAERHKCVIPKRKKCIFVFSMGVWLAGITLPMEEHIPSVTCHPRHFVG